MSEKIKELKRLLHEKAKSQIPIQTEWVKVKSVDWGNKTMLGIGESNGLDYEDVLLGLGSVYKRPKSGSLALIGLINNSAGCYLIDCEGYEEIEINAKLTNIKVKENGIAIQRNDESLQKVLEDLIKEKNKMNKEIQKVATMAGAASSVPVLIEIFTQTELINQRLNSILISE